MTRQEIKAKALSNAGVLGAEPTYRDPFSLNDWVDEGVSEFCRLFDNVYVTFRTDIVSGTSVYCFPDLQYLESVSLIDPSGALQFLRLGSERDLADLVDGFRVRGATPGTPTFAGTRGTDSIEIYPTPNYSVNSGLIFTGFGRIVRDMWVANTAECPLPLRTHTCIVAYVAWKLCERARDFEMAQIQQKLYRREKNLFEGEMHRLTEANRHRFPNAGGVMSGFNPLNQ